MNSPLALRTLLLLALVAVASAVLVQPGLGGGDQAAHAMLIVARN